MLVTRIARCDTVFLAVVEIFESFNLIFNFLTIYIIIM